MTACVRPVGHLQLQEDVRGVVAHRLHAQEQRLGYLLVALALGDEGEDLLFAFGELGEGASRRAGGRGAEVVHQALGDGGTEDGLAAGHPQDTSREQLRAIHSLGDLPVVVLASGVFLREAPTRPEAGPRLHEIWQDLQRDLADLSSNSVYSVVESSGHFIQRDQPEVVVDAIRRVLDSVPQA